MSDKDTMNFDPRPKRRKSKENPYSLLTIGMHTGSPRYYVFFRTPCGKQVCSEVQQEVFEAMNQFELDDLRYLNEIANHYEHSELTEKALLRRATEKKESIDTVVLNKSKIENLKGLIGLLPILQRRRLILHYYGHYTCKEIAHMDGCSNTVVKKSLEAARENLKKLLEGTIPPTL